MDDAGWTKTRRGRRIYNRPIHFFSAVDANRILSQVLEFEKGIDLDSQVSRLFKFLFNFGFLPKNLKFTSIPKSEDPLYSMVEDLVLKAASRLGVPEIALKIADEVGNLLAQTFAPSPEALQLAPALVKLIKDALDASIAEGKGEIWLPVTENKVV